MLDWQVSLIFVALKIAQVASNKLVWAVLQRKWKGGSANSFSYLCSVPKSLSTETGWEDSLEHGVIHTSWEALLKFTTWISPQPSMFHKVSGISRAAEVICLLGSLLEASTGPTVWGPFCISATHQPQGGQFHMRLWECKCPWTGPFSYSPLQPQHVQPIEIPKKCG